MTYDEKKLLRLIEERLNEMDPAVAKRAVDGILNAPVVKRNRDRCPNCGYCEHCGQSRNPTPVWIGPWYQPSYQYQPWTTKDDFTITLTPTGNS